MRSRPFLPSTQYFCCSKTPFYSQSISHHAQSTSNPPTTKHGCKTRPHKPTTKAPPTHRNSRTTPPSRIRAVQAAETPPSR
ncbi:uncharacterized protein EKO05_0005483 [Ascochyta rabiei]|uniref:uncharacterized protein n=1 Tax=Didymella rabiei TaxID=5454 RepID=UPI0022066EA5|nr:uncharacterized protein EKO05_0005483 [Ascochyta rabiei]UPX15015.1 hypothetical protein EKO05_0005483 [Ascochyta rabiei]